MSGQDGEPQPLSDLIDWSHHEHAHLTHLFDDLRATFNRIAAGDLARGARRDAIAEARDDLRGALDDMLAHFSEEEEIYFGAIEAQFAELAPQIAGLVEAHESICRDLRRLEARLAAEPSDEELSAGLLALVNEVSVELERHNRVEDAIFRGALGRMSAEERRALRARPAAHAAAR